MLSRWCVCNASTSKTKNSSLFHNNDVLLYVHYDQKMMAMLAKGKVLPGIEPGSPGCPTSQAVMSIRTGSDNRYTIKPCFDWIYDIR